MLPLIVRQNEQGMTLIEMAIAAVIVGVLAAIAIPSILQLKSSNDVKAALDQVQNALKDAQRQAIRKSGECEITLNLANNPPKITPNEAGCLISSTSTNEIPNGVIILSNLSGKPPKIKFSFKGQTNKAGTLVFYSDKANEKKCLVISRFLGIMRTGDYEGNISSIDEKKCNTSLATF